MICVDASVAAKWIFTEELAEPAEALYLRAITAGERIVAPPLLPIEITNIIRQRMRRSKEPEQVPLSLSEAATALRLFLSFPVELTMPSELHRRALELSDTCGLPAVYDAHYLALAQMLDCEFWTADQKFVNALEGKHPFVRWLGDYKPT